MKGIISKTLNRWNNPLGVASFFRWFLFLVLMVLGVVISYYFGVFHAIWLADSSKISFLIMGSFITATFWTGHLTFLQEAKESSLNILHFISDTFIRLGLVGTVIGFILMMSNLLQTLDPSNPNSIKAAIVQMGTGMGTALFTTLVGMVSSILLNLQIVNLENIDEKK